MRAELAARISGSAELFHHRFRRTWASVNYVASHDGFTLADVVAYGRKHNEANGENNADGHNENFSKNWGAEGPTDDSRINETRARIVRAMLASLLTALGTPMLLAGDEFGRTQRSNNNAYCQDNELSWIDWRVADSVQGRALTAFVARLIALRKHHPLLRETHFLQPDREVLPGIHAADWFDHEGNPLVNGDWHAAQGQTLALRRAGPDAAGRLEVLMLLYNASADDVVFTLAPPRLEWNLLIDTTVPETANHGVSSEAVCVGSHGFVLLAAPVPKRHDPPQPPASA
jgi:glycogen operon protein